MLNKITTTLLGLLFAPSIFALTTTPSESLRVWFDNVTITPDGESVAYLRVYENDNIDYSAFNMTFIIPQGLKINKIKKGRDLVNDIELSERASSTHSISCNILPDGTTLRVISTSSQNDNLYNDDESGTPLDLLYTIGLIADKDMHPGTYPIEMTGIKFVIKNGDACVLPQDHVYGEITVLGNPTSLQEISAEEIAEDTEPWYDLKGCRVINPQSGQIVVSKGKKFIIR